MSLSDGATARPDLGMKLQADAMLPGPPQANDLMGVSDPTLIEERPYNNKIPDSYDASKPTPLLVLLHGFTASGQLQDLYLGLGNAATERGWLFAFPDGTQNPAGLRYWDATDACCNFANPPQDDVAYLNAVIDDMKTHYNVDPKRVYLFGHSNGAFMSHRLACDSADRIAGIASLAGSTWNDEWRCAPSVPVGVLEIHGTLDVLVAYNGGSFFPTSAAYPGARDTVSRWASLNGCGELTDTSEKMDIETLIPFAETKVARASGCKENGAAELWTMQGVGHVPILNDTFKTKLFEFYDAHPKP